MPRTPENGLLSQRIKNSVVAAGVIVAGGLGGIVETSITHVNSKTNKTPHEHVLQENSPLGERYAQLLTISPGEVNFMCHIFQVTDIPVINETDGKPPVFVEDAVATQCGEPIGVKDTKKPVDWKPLDTQKPSSTKVLIENGHKYTVVLDEYGTPIVAIETSQPTGITADTIDAFSGEGQVVNKNRTERRLT